MGTESTFLWWANWEDPLLFAGVVLSVAVVLITWAFRSAQVVWWVRVIHKLGIVALASRAYLVRTIELERGWLTNAVTIFFLVTQLLMLAAVIAESGLVAPRRVAPRHVK